MDDIHMHMTLIIFVAALCEKNTNFFHLTGCKKFQKNGFELFDIDPH